MRTIKLWFFGEELPAQDNTSNGDIDAMQEIENSINSVFDKTSPLLSVGGVAQEEGTTTEQPTFETGSGNSSGEATQTQPSPFKILKGADGNDIPFATEADYERAALEGIGAGAIRQRVGAYEPFLSALENDPALAQSVLATLQAHRAQANGIPVTAPQPTQPPKDDDPEPEQGDDELIEDFDARHRAWEEKKHDRDIEKRVSSVLQERQNAEYQARVNEVRARAFAGVREDSVGEQVISSLLDKSMPPALKDLCDKDPAVLMCVYDAMRILQGQGGYFGSPVCVWDKRAQAVSPQSGTQQTVQSGGIQNTAQKSAQPIQIKGQGGTAPFTEGSASRVSAQKGFPNVNEMSDDQFKAFQRQLENGYMTGRL